MPLIETFQVKCGFGDYILDFYLNVFLVSLILSKRHLVFIDRNRSAFVELISYVVTQ